MLLITIAASLVARSASDIWMIQSVTIIESTIIQMDRRKFINTLLKYCSALPLVMTHEVDLIAVHRFNVLFPCMPTDCSRQQCVTLEHR